MEPLCKFLSFDLYTILAELFNGLGSVWCMCLGRPKGNCIGMTEVIHPSYTIRHKYPNRLITYDGEARCEPRLIRFSDLTKSNVNVMQPQCEKNMAEECLKKEGCEKVKEEDNSEQAKEDEKCEAKIVQCQAQPNTKILSHKNLIKSTYKCSQSRAQPKTVNQKTTKEEDFSFCPNDIPNKEELLQREQHAKELYENFLQCSLEPEESKSTPTWESLKPVQKLRFYWQAYTGDKLYATPYENFRQSFKQSYLKVYPNTHSKSLRIEMRRHWWCLDRCQRLPFILQALLYHVSNEALDPNDHCAVRDLFNRLR